MNCNTSWKIVLFMKWSDNKDDILKGVKVTIRLSAEDFNKNIFEPQSIVHLLLAG